MACAGVPSSVSCEAVALPLTGFLFGRVFILQDIVSRFLPIPGAILAAQNGLYGYGGGALPLPAADPAQWPATMEALQGSRATNYFRKLQFQNR